MSSIRQRVMDAIGTRLRTINTAAGYRTNAGLNVGEWRDGDSESIQEEEGQSINYRDASEQIESLDVTATDHFLSVEIIGSGSAAAGDPKLAPAQLRDIARDIQWAIGIDPTFGGLVHKCLIQSSQMSVARKAKQRGSINLTYEVRFKTKAFDEDTLHTAPA